MLRFGTKDHQDRQDPDSERQVLLQTRRIRMHQVPEETRFSSSSTTRIIKYHYGRRPRTQQVPLRAINTASTKFHDDPSTARTFVPLPSPWIRQVPLQQVYLYRRLRNR
uniref:Uncharacterized protein n=1 Tax=Triticum urartu TaxID=4572 RepID=A0A8R7NYF7_TRIUA